MARARHNVDAKVASEVCFAELASMANDIADLVAGGVVGKRNVGIAAVLNRKQSPPSSKPGEIPHKLTGNLGRSWRTRVRGRIRGRAIAEAGSDAPYARTLEFGTGRMAARPYVAEGIRLAYPFITRRLRRVEPRIRFRLRTRIKPL